MKVAIITFHRAINYGAVLQVLALQESIMKLNHEATVIDYRCKAIEEDYKNIRLKKGVGLKSIVNNVISYPIRYKKKKEFYRFVEKNLNLSSSIYSSNAELIKSNDEYDIFITGSDQVWDDKCVKFDKAYFLDFVSESSKKNSYAASFSFGELPNDLKEEYRARLKDFNNISVREEVGKKIFGQLLNKNIVVSLDPTLLLNKEEWSKYATERLIEQKYILIYSVHAPNKLFKFAEELSNKTGFKLVNINDSWQRKVNAKYLRGISPSEYLSLFKNAQYILTNSFHGTVFSLIFNKKFMVELVSKTNKINHRSKHLLELLGLEDRILENIDGKWQDDDIDYKNVNCILEIERKKSIQYLENILKR